MLWQVLDHVASWLARTGDIEFASVLYGHLDEYHPPWGSGPDRQDRATTASRPFATTRTGSVWMSQGTSMTRDDLVAYALADSCGVQRHVCRAVSRGLVWSFADGRLPRERRVLRCPSAVLDVGRAFLARSPR